MLSDKIKSTTLATLSITLAVLSIIAAALMGSIAPANAGAAVECEGARSSTVPAFDLQRYQGIWYEIAHYEVDNALLGSRNAFSRYYPDLVDPTFLHVSHETDRLAGATHTARVGELRMTDPAVPGELTMRTATMTGYQNTPYHILALGKDYSWAMVGEPSRQHLWILSRAPFLAAHELEDIIYRAQVVHGYADAAKKLRCTTQAENYHQICEVVLSVLRDQI